MARQRGHRWGKGDWQGGINIRVAMQPGPRALANAFEEFKDELRDYSRAWQKLIPVLISEEQKIFATQGAPLAEYWGQKANIPWDKLTTAYARRRSFRRISKGGRFRKRNRAERRAVGPVDQTARLQLTGKLLSKLTSPSAGRIQPMKLTFGVYNLPYAKGIMFDPGGFGDRPFLGKTRRILGAADVLLREEVNKKIDDLGRRLNISKAEIFDRIALRSVR